MNTVVLEVRSLTETLTDAAHSMNTGRAEHEAHIGFATPELLWQVLTGKRWQLLRAMCGAGPISIREAARRVHRAVADRARGLDAEEQVVEKAGRVRDDRAAKRVDRDVGATVPPCR